MRDTTRTEVDDDEPEWEEPPEEIDFEALADTTEAPEVVATDSAPFWEGLPADLELTFDIVWTPANPFLGIWSNIKFRGTEAE